mgnify:CR=1 FL=1
MIGCAKCFDEELGIELLSGRMKQIRVVPDGNASGLHDVRSLSSGIAQLSSVKVNLKVNGEFIANPGVITDKWLDKGRVVYGDMKTGAEATVDRYPTPDELWAETFQESNEWRERYEIVVRHSTLPLR